MAKEKEFSEWCAKRDSFLTIHTGLSSSDWPDLVMYRDHFDDELSPETSAALLMEQVAWDQGITLADMCPEMQEYL